MYLLLFDSGYWTSQTETECVCSTDNLNSLIGLETTILPHTSFYMNSAGRWLPAKATRNPHGVKEKEVFSSKANSHSFIPSLLLPIFHPTFPLYHRPDPHFLDLLHLPLPSSTSPSPRDQDRTRSLSLFVLTSAILPAFYTLKAPYFISVLFFSFYPLQLLALVLSPFRIVSFDTHVLINLMMKDIKTNKLFSEARNRIISI